MDVLIKNMELPKKGHFLFQISANGDVWVTNRNDEGTGIIIAKAIELPPHGRLVDLDAYLKAYENMSDWEEYRVEEIEEYFKNAPVVVEAST